ncbi:hypothetical protein ADUPG1_009660, partial [Aduncisulcus paluster]
MVDFNHVSNIPYTAQQILASQHCPSPSEKYILDLAQHPFVLSLNGAEITSHKTICVQKDISVQSSGTVHHRRPLLVSIQQLLQQRFVDLLVHRKIPLANITKTGMSFFGGCLDMDLKRGIHHHSYMNIPSSSSPAYSIDITDSDNPIINVCVHPTEIIHLSFKHRAATALKQRWAEGKTFTAFSPFSTFSSKGISPNPDHTTPEKKYLQFSPSFPTPLHVPRSPLFSSSLCDFGVTLWMCNRDAKGNSPSPIHHYITSLISHTSSFSYIPLRKKGTAAVNKGSIYGSTGSVSMFTSFPRRKDSNPDDVSHRSVEVRLNGVFGGSMVSVSRAPDVCFPPLCLYSSETQDQSPSYSSLFIPHFKSPFEEGIDVGNSVYFNLHPLHLYFDSPPPSTPSSHEGTPGDVPKDIALPSTSSVVTPMLNPHAVPISDSQKTLLRKPTCSLSSSPISIYPSRCKHSSISSECVSSASIDRKDADILSSSHSTQQRDNFVPSFPPNPVFKEAHVRDIVAFDQACRKSSELPSRITLTLDPVITLKIRVIGGCGIGESQREGGSSPVKRSMSLHGQDAYPFNFSSTHHYVGNTGFFKKQGDDTTEEELDIDSRIIDDHESNVPKDIALPSTSSVVTPMLNPHAVPISDSQKTLLRKPTCSLSSSPISIYPSRCKHSSISSECVSSASIDRKDADILSSSHSTQQRDNFVPSFPPNPVFKEAHVRDIVAFDQACRKSSELPSRITLTLDPVITLKIRVIGGCGIGESQREGGSSPVKRSMSLHGQDAYPFNFSSTHHYVGNTGCGCHQNYGLGAGMRDRFVYLPICCSFNNEEVILRVREWIRMMGMLQGGEDIVLLSNFKDSAGGESSMASSQHQGSFNEPAFFLSSTGSYAILKESAMSLMSLSSLCQCGVGAEGLVSEMVKRAESRQREQAGVQSPSLTTHLIDPSQPSTSISNFFLSRCDDLTLIIVTSSNPSGATLPSIVGATALSEKSKSPLPPQLKKLSKQLMCSFSYSTGLNVHVRFIGPDYFVRNYGVPHTPIIEKEFLKGAVNEGMARRLMKLFGQNYDYRLISGSGVSTKEIDSHQEKGKETPNPDVSSLPPIVVGKDGNSFGGGWYGKRRHSSMVVNPEYPEDSFLNKPDLLISKPGSSSSTSSSSQDAPSPPLVLPQCCGLSTPSSLIFSSILPPHYLQSLERAPSSLHWLSFKSSRAVHRQLTKKELKALFVIAQKREYKDEALIKKDEKEEERTSHVAPDEPQLEEIINEDP